MAEKKKILSWRAQVILIFAGLMALMFMPTTVLLGVGMIPTFVAVFIDRTRKKSQVFTVGAMNLAGCSLPLFELWRRGNDMSYAMDIAFDPKTIVIMYGAAGIGYLIDWSMAGIVASVLYQRGIARQAEIIQRQKYLVERWGEEVTGKIPLDDMGYPIQTGAQDED